MSVAASPWPISLAVRRAARELAVAFDDGSAFALPARLLRAMTPSAQAHGHGGPDFAPVKVLDEVGLIEASPVGRYAVRLRFDDGHSSGLYTWDRLHRIGREAATLTSELDAL
ncbi:DUF971 domain-containing protein [soil metagenome]